MLSDGPKKRLEKTWEELVSAASMETDPEKLATMMEEIFAALDERERTPSCHKIHLASVSVPQRLDDSTQSIGSDTGAKALLTKAGQVPPRK